MEAQLAGLERGADGLPLLGSTARSSSTTVRHVVAEQIPESGHEATGRQFMQIQDRQHLGHLRRSPSARRQDPRAEPLAPTLLIDALVVDARRPDETVPNLTVRLRSGAAVADNQPLAVLIDLADQQPTYCSTSASKGAAERRRAWRCVRRVRPKSGQALPARRLLGALEGFTTSVSPDRAGSRVM
jgi:hypothetical protein